MCRSRRVRIADHGFARPAATVRGADPTILLASPISAVRDSQYFAFTPPSPWKGEGASVRHPERFHGFHEGGVDFAAVLVWVAGVLDHEDHHEAAPGIDPEVGGVCAAVASIRLCRRW